MTNSSGNAIATKINPLRVVLGGLLLFLLVNLVFAAIDPPIAGLTLLNRVLPGFRRFPAPRVTLEKNGVTTVTAEFVANLDVLFASHVIVAKEKPKDEYRIILIGDSTVWGSQLELDQTLTEQINQAQLTSCDGRSVVAYNLGYPGVSAIKDMMILSESVETYQPDLVMWFFTLTILVPERQRDMGFSVVNYGRLRAIEETAGYDFGSGKHVPDKAVFMDRTLYGRRRELAYLLRLYMFDLKSLALGTDYLRGREQAEFDLGAGGQEDNFFEFTPDDNLVDELNLNFLRAADRIAGNIPVLYINEPILIEGNNSVRYNQVYPRWAYDQYRDLLSQLQRENSWIYLDLWDLIPPGEFVDTDFHRTPAGERRVAQGLIPILQSEACK